MPIHKKYYQQIKNYNISKNYILFFIKIMTQISKQQKNKHYFSIIQAGNLQFSNNKFSSAFMMFGYSQMGKTTSAHYLCNSKLKSINNNGRLEYRCFQESKYSKCVIGNGKESMTEISNVFEYPVNCVESVVIDQPGFGDSLGLHRIISNGYFHYLTFSKIEKIKFIIVIDINCLDGLGEQLLDTFVQFFNLFNQYQKIKQIIMKASCFLITKVQPFMTIEDIKQNMEGYIQTISNKIKQPYKTWFRQFLKHLIEFNKIIIFAKPSAIGVISPQNDILKQINSKTQFFIRKIKNNIVDMSPINYSVSYQILNRLKIANGPQRYHEDFQSLMKQSYQRFQNILFKQQGQSLKNLILSLKQDCSTYKTYETSLKLQHKMIGFKAKYYDQFQISLEQSRQQRQKQIFGQLFTIYANQNQLMKTFFMQKLNVLKQIVLKAQSILKIQNLFQNQYTEKQLQRMNETEAFIIFSIKQLSKLVSLKPTDKSIIYRFGYVLYRLIDQMKALNMILFDKRQCTQELMKLKNQIILKLINRMTLKDNFYAHIADIKILDLQKINKLEVKLQNIQMVLDYKIINYLRQIPVQNNKRNIEISQFLLKYYKKLIQQSNDATQLTMMESALLEERQFYYKIEANRQNETNIYKNIYTTISNKMFSNRIIKMNSRINQIYDPQQQVTDFDIYQQSHTLIFRITNLLAQHYFKQNNFETAKLLYKSINNCQQVFNCYHQQLSRKTTKKDLLNYYVEYGLQAVNYCRNEFAFQCFQKAFSHAETSYQIRKCAQLIFTQLVNGKQEDFLKKILQSNSYINKIYYDNYIQNFERKNIGNLKFVQKSKELQKTDKINVQKVFQSSRNN